MSNRPAEADATKLDVAQTAFETNPNQDTAAMFLSVLREYEEDGMIGDDTFHNGLALVEAYLWKGGTVVPS